MKHIKIIIIFIIISIIVITILLLGVKSFDKKQREENFENTITMEVKNTINSVENRNDFFAIKSCITKYLSYITEESNYMEEENIDTTEQNSKALYSLLDKNYIEEYNVTEKDVLNDQKIYKDPIFYASKMYVIQDTYSVYTYFVYGKHETAPCSVRPHCRLWSKKKA